MGRHLSEEALWDAASEGAPEAGAADHLEACAACRGRLREAAEGLRMAREDGGVPEPSPLYWEAFRRQVGRRVAEEAAPSALRALRRWLVPAALVPVAAAALAVALRTGAAVPAAVPSPLPAWQALPESEDDAGLDVLRGLALSEGGLDATAGCPDLQDCLLALTDEEGVAFSDALKQRLEEVLS